MKTRKFFKRGIATLFAVVLTFCALAPTVKVQAVKASPRTLMELRYIVGDGVRLRKEPNPDGTVLGLMYNGDEINYYADITGPKPYEYYVYMTRSASPNAGYVDKQYTSRTKPSF